MTPIVPAIVSIVAITAAASVSGTLSRFEPGDPVARASSPPPRLEALQGAPANVAVQPGLLFATADTCMSCHNGLIAPSGEDISIGFDWRSSMMANSARDPYWHAGVRREVMDHPESEAAIQHECAACHMPMTRYAAHLNGQHQPVFAHLPDLRVTAPDAVMAADGVSCTACHRIENDKLGTRESFTAGFVVRPVAVNAARGVYGPFEIDKGRTRLMESATGFRPTESAHIQKSEMCATCHTLFTHALGPGGEVLGELPEQVPYLEWLHSEYREKKSCQSCHMPVVEGETPVSSVLAQAREGVSRHEFRGGNFFMPRILNRFANDLAVTALPQELDRTARRAIDHLATETAVLTIESASVEAGRLVAGVSVENLAGHKLPTAYPSRRAWLHVTVRDSAGSVVFESGRVGPDGAIAGNDNDRDGSRFEPHYTEIDSPEKVQIYEPIMVDNKGSVTTGLLSGVRYVKDNRLLPHGFDKTTADADVAVRGGALEDPDFTAGGDKLRYVVDVGSARGPFEVEAELLYQPIAHRWARNLAGRGAPETDRFIRLYEAMSQASWTLVARIATTVTVTTGEQAIGNQRPVASRLSH